MSDFSLSGRALIMLFACTKFVSDSSSSKSAASSGSISSINFAAASIFNLEINSDKNILTYIYDTKGENTGITSLLSEIKALGMQLKDISTEQSSLESIFLNLVKESENELVRS